MSKTKAGALTRAGKRYKKKHGSWGAGGNDDSPLVDSGQLRQALTADEKQINKGVVYVGVASGKSDSKKGDPGSYAATHEFGYEPKNIPARPFLRPALHENRDQIKEIAKKEVIKSLRRLGH
nr:HK97-gp10 family putative phage morphogenesis protein [Brevibacillus laterosporus]